MQTDEHVCMRTSHDPGASLDTSIMTHHDISYDMTYLVELSERLAGEYGEHDLHHGERPVRAHLLEGLERLVALGYQHGYGYVCNGWLDCITA